MAFSNHFLWGRYYWLGNRKTSRHFCYAWRVNCYCWASHFWLLLFSLLGSVTSSKNLAKLCERGGLENFLLICFVCADFSLWVSDADLVFSVFYTNAIYSMGNKLLVVESLRLGHNYDFKHRIY